MDEGGITIEQAAVMLQNMPLPKPVYWRLYYDADGLPTNYSMEELPGNYIEIDAETFSRGALDVRVINGKIKKVTKIWSQKIVPGTSGTPCHPNNVAVVVSTEQPHTKWSKRIYETN